LKCSFPLFGH